MGYGPTESENHVSQTTTVSHNSDAESLGGYGVQPCITIARFITSKSA